eukprot:3677059-Rhodomonas_salina.1
MRTSLGHNVGPARAGVMESRSVRQRVAVHDLSSAGKLTPILDTHTRHKSRRTRPVVACPALACPSTGSQMRSRDLHYPTNKPALPRPTAVLARYCGVRDIANLPSTLGP